MSEKKGKRKKHKNKPKNIVNDYVLTNVVFLSILLVVTVCIIFGTIKPVTAFVHKIESQANMKVGDIVIDRNSDMIPYSKENSQFGDFVANLTCESKGLNTSVYLGLNRASTRYGAGLSSTDSFFTETGTAVVSGYDETYFGSLKYLEIGDKITVTTADSVITYEVKDAYYESGGVDLSSAKNDLVIYSTFSDFSENSGKFYYVLADKINGEVD